jgi:transposase
MSTTDGQAPVAQGSLGLGADRKNECRELFRVGHSQRDLAERYDVTQTTIWRWCRGVERAEPQSTELSVRQAVASAAELGFVGLTKETIEGAIKSDRLIARWGERSASFGRTGPKEHWIIEREELDAFLASLETCPYPDCVLPGVTPDGFCGREHAMSVTIKALDPEMGRQRAREWWRFPPAPQATKLIARAGGESRRLWKLRWTRSPGRPKSYTDEQADWVLALGAKGYSIDRTAQTVGVSRDTVRRIRGRQKRS